MTTEDHTRGPVPCDQVGMFVDGELDAERAEAFRHHLVQCARCQSEMHALMQLAGLAEEASRADVRRVEAPALPPPAHLWRKRASRWAPAAGALLAAAVVAVVLVKQRRGADDVPTLLASLDARTVSGWPSALGVTTYHGYDTVRGLSPTPAAPRLSSAELRAEQAEDWRTAGTLALLRRDFGRADGFLARLPQRPDVLADRGLVLLEQGSCDEALEYLDRALREDPGYAPARFNRGLCLRRLDFAAAASSTFESLASASLGGWSAEAKAQVDDLRRGLSRQSAAEEAFEASGPDSLDRQAPIPPQLVAQFPGRARYRFYRMLALAPTAVELRRLMPVAEGLDRDFGTSVLEARVHAALAQVRPERAAIARELATFYRMYPSGSQVDALLARALHARQDDQALQLYNDFKEMTVTPDRIRLTRLADDPHAQVWLAAATAFQQQGAGRVLDAEQTLRKGREACKDESLALPCWYLDIQRMEVERALSRFDSATRIAQASARKMRVLGLRGPERNARLEAANVLLAAGKVAAARGSYEDIGLREPDACQVTVYRAERLAAGYVRRGDVVGARAALEGLPPCRLAQMEPWRLALRLDMALREQKPDALAGVIETARAFAAAPDTTRQDRALAEVYAARAATELDRPGASTELAAALRGLEPFASEVESRQARAHGWAALALAELRRGDGPAALQALASQLGLESPGKCTVGLVANGARQGWIAVDGSGTTAQRLEPATDGASSVPRLAGCPSVAVLAAGWEHVERALPSDVAWTVRLTPTTSGEGTVHGEQLLVRDVRPPADLQLPPLGLQTARTAGDWSLLEGAEATPERVLRALRRASYAEFEVHGLIDADLPDGAFLALSEDSERRYALSARELEGQTFSTRPIVMLGACRAAAGSTLRDEAWMLPKAFLSAGARGVFAARVELPDAEVGTFFAGIRERLDRGEQPSTALRDEKLTWLGKGRTWVRDVLLFD